MRENDQGQNHKWEAKHCVIFKTETLLNQFARKITSKMVERALLSKVLENNTWSLQIIPDSLNIHQQWHLSYENLCKKMINVYFTKKVKASWCYRNRLFNN